MKQRGGQKKKDETKINTTRTSTFDNRDGRRRRWGYSRITVGAKRAVTTEEGAVRHERTGGEK